MENGKNQVSVDTDLKQKMASYIQQTDLLIGELRQERDALQQKVAGMEKSASVADTVSAESVARTVQKLVGAGFLKEGARDQAVAAISSKPATALLDFVEKLADQQISRSGQTMPKLGHAVGQDKPAGTSPMKESDRVFEQRFGTLSK